MPHVVIKMWPGRTEEQKKACAREVKDAVVRTLGVPANVTSVSVQEIPQSQWNTRVVEGEMKTEGELIIPPEY